MSFLRPRCDHDNTYASRAPSPSPPLSLRGGHLCRDKEAGSSKFAVAQHASVAFTLPSKSIKKETLTPLRMDSSMHLRTHRTQCWLSHRFPSPPNSFHRAPSDREWRPQNRISSSLCLSPSLSRMVKDSRLVPRQENDLRFLTPQSNFKLNGSASLCILNWINGGLGRNRAPQYRQFQHV